MLARISVKNVRQILALLPTAPVATQSGFQGLYGATNKQRMHTIFLEFT
jgi:hypothetical protein